ncbi:Hypothetical predicted protein, partial [Marmota monax]
QHHSEIGRGIQVTKKNYGCFTSHLLYHVADAQSFTWLGSWALQNSRGHCSHRCVCHGTVSIHYTVYGQMLGAMVTLQPPLLWPFRNK